MNSPTINRARYRKVVWFFATVFISVIWWDLLIRKIPVLGLYSQRTNKRRWGKLARRFRALAIEMGGVLIKLGQFLSIRVDVLPLEVTSELAGLQDEVPAADITEIIALIESEFNRPLQTIFTKFDPRPLGAASLAQTHRAILTSGESLVVKILRPGIETMVATDLAAIAQALQWLKWYRTVSKRVDLDKLSEEFINVTNDELDFVLEGKSAEQFAADFADDPVVYIPKIYWDYTTRRVLAMENVGYIQMGDLPGMDAVGISRPLVAKKLYQIFMRQVFVSHFVHADPHPGNMFIKPLPGSLPSDGSTPFQIIFVDFGMAVTIPQRLRGALREYAIGLGTRDAHRIVQAYVQAGALLPNADLQLIEEAHDAIFAHFWGTKMSKMQDLAMEKAPELLEEYRDLIHTAPFQFQSDMLFVVRAIGILAGMATNLDPDFDPWNETIPFATKLAAEDLQANWQDYLQSGFSLAQTIYRLPGRLDRVLTDAERGNLVVKNALAPDTRRKLNQIENAAHRLTWGVTSAALLLSGAILRSAEGETPLTTGLILGAAAVFLWKVARRSRT